MSAILSPPSRLFDPLPNPELKLFGPGPSNVHPRVAAAYSGSVLPPGHYLLNRLLLDVSAGLRYVFQTRNEHTFTVAGTGHAGMECALTNVVERGDRVMIGENGLWGERASKIAKRLGADLIPFQKPIGHVFELGEIESALEKHRPAVLFLTHGESTGGVVQPLEGVGRVCRKYNCLLIVDAVASLGGVPLFTDEWEIDVVYAGSQKVLSAPTGMAPITFGPRAWKKISERKTEPPTHYFNADTLSKSAGIGGSFFYHATWPSHGLLALREALLILAEEGLENSWKKHREVVEAFWEMGDKLGLKWFVSDKALRLPTVTLVEVPPHVKDWKVMLQYLLDEYNIAVLGGLGPSVGKVWRVGLMGWNAKIENARLVANALAKGIDYCSTEKGSQL
ncbi:alanine--glyoxylate aminotransferase-like [Oscarella lobularis]|uniref:alanine--glyoxylate aminotransferase-like n=1 Tax=Oscarella lobularis TaxID=121494 RepID=UPI0033137E23